MWRSKSRAARASYLGNCVAITGMLPSAVLAGGIPGTELREVVVTATRAGLVGEPVSASEGFVVSEQLENRPMMRTAEVLEVVPGLVVTQHSGDGKANQYFLRGFNLDHGTDFATSVDGTPVNMRTHAHGQGYSDLNFLIPELIDRIDYRKGPYYADEGDFSAAGAVSIRYKRRVDAPFLTLEGGEYAFGRALGTHSFEAGGGDVLLAAAYQRTAGPWGLDEDAHKASGLIKYTRGDAERHLSLTVMGYGSRWNSTDQIPERAVASGQIDRFGFVDGTDGGDTHRYSATLDVAAPLGPGTSNATLYMIDYGLDLFSNFTYFTRGPQGDQFEQLDDRRVYGGSWKYDALAGAGERIRWSSGIQWRYDDIGAIALYDTQARKPLSTVRSDSVRESSYSAFSSLGYKWADRVRAQAGLRFDYYMFDDRSSLDKNSGRASDSTTSPKLALTFSPWEGTELFVDFGRSFHSNDARGVTVNVDPADGVTPVGRVEPLTRATGGELGVRSAAMPGLQVAASLWTLALDSELVFSGDAGSTEPARGSRRTGVELGLYYVPTDWAILDMDLAWSRARFAHDTMLGDYIPGAVERVGSLGVNLRRPAGWFGGAHLRYLGTAALVEDDSVRSSGSLLLNLDVGFRFSDHAKVRMLLLNALDRRANDIMYYYQSQLQNETAPRSGIHFHPFEPRTLRLSITFTL